MNTASRLAGFGVVLGIMLGGAWAVGAAVGPLEVVNHDHGADTKTHGGHLHGDAQIGRNYGGLVTQDGYRLDLAATVAPAGTTPLSFVVFGPDGKPVTRYDRPLELVAVRRDVAGFQRLQPTLDPRTGRWTTQATLTAGPWRVFADLDPAGGNPVVLGGDLLVGDDAKAAVPAPVRERIVDTVDGYTATLQGNLTTGKRSLLTLSVARDGVPVNDLGRFLGAYGHLTVLRDGDLAYLPTSAQSGDGTARPGPDLRFTTEVPTTAVYHLFLEFRHGGRTHVARFTLESHDD